MFRAYYLFIGLLAAVAQFTLLREAVTAAQGNEAAYVFVLFLWLLGTGAGSFWGQRLSDRLRFRPRAAGRPPAGLFVLPVIVALLLPGCVLLLRFIGRFGVLAGQDPALSTLLWLLPAAVVPLCLLVGLMFVAGVRSFPAPGRRHDLINRAYLLEGAGFALGGLLFYLLLVQAGPLVSAGLLLALALLLPATAVSGSRQVFSYVGAGLILVSTLLLSGRFDSLTLASRYPGRELVAVEDTPYQRIVVARRQGQTDVFLSGALAGSTATPEAAEQLVHLSFANRGRFEKVLVLGGGIGGVLHEVLKYPTDRVVYAELDPRLVELGREHLDSLRADLADPRVETVISDSREYLEGTDELFDAVVLSSPDPLNLNLNRFHTAEFYEAVRRRLTPGGLFVTALPFAANAPHPLQLQAARTSYQTLLAAFPYVLALPESQIVFVASEAWLEYKAEAKMSRFAFADLPTGFVTADYIEYRYQNDRILPTLDELRQETQVNRDLFPTLFFQKHLERSLIHGSTVSGLGEIAGELFYRWRLPLALILFLAFLLQFLRRRGRTDAYPYLMSVVAGAGLLYQILAIYLFQVEYGFVYREIALITSALMAGFVLGTWLFRKGEQWLMRQGLPLLMVLLVSYAALFPLLTADFGYKRPVIWLFSLLLGLTQGLAFAFLNTFYQQSLRAAAANYGRIYGAELLGAAVAVPASLLLIPLWGVKSTVTFLGAVFGVLALAVLLLWRTCRVK